MFDRIKDETLMKDIHEHVKTNCAHVLAIISIMRKDDGVDFDGEYGRQLDSLESVTIALYKVTYEYVFETLSVVPKIDAALVSAKMYNTYQNIITSHQTTIDCVEAYSQTMGE